MIHQINSALMMIHSVDILDYKKKSIDLDNVVYQWSYMRYDCDQVEIDYPRNTGLNKVKEI